MKENFKLKCVETFKDFKCLLTRYREVKEDEKLYKMFMTRNRNPLWDLSNSPYLRTGLKSTKVIESGIKGVDDHFIQRSKAMKWIFFELNNNPDMGLEQFIELLKTYSSTVELTKEEHTKVTIFTKNKNVLNYEVYSKIGIIIEGLDEFVSRHTILH